MLVLQKCLVGVSWRVNVWVYAWRKGVVNLLLSHLDKGGREILGSYFFNICEPPRCDGVTCDLSTYKLWPRKPQDNVRVFGVFALCTVALDCWLWLKSLNFRLGMDSNLVWELWVEILYWKSEVWRSLKFANSKFEQNLVTFQKIKYYFFKKSGSFFGILDFFKLSCNENCPFQVIW